MKYKAQQPTQVKPKLRAVRASAASCSLSSKHTRLHGSTSCVTAGNSEGRHPTEVSHRSALGGYQASSSIPKLMSCPNFNFSSHLRYHQGGFCPWKRIPTKGRMADISQISVLATSPLLPPHTSNRSHFHIVVANTW